MKLLEHNTYELPQKAYYYNIRRKSCFRDFRKELKSLKKHLESTGQNLIILCVGSDRATGDCLGPIIGEQLSAHFSHRHSLCLAPTVYGTLQHPVHAVNLKQTMEQIYDTFLHPYILAIDASLGIPSHIGYITLGKGPLFPGIGVQKSLPHIGDAAITGIVNSAGKNSHITLQTTKLSTVVEIASFISDAILSVYH